MQCSGSLLRHRQQWNSINLNSRTSGETIVPQIIVVILALRVFSISFFVIKKTLLLIPLPLVKVKITGFEMK